MKELIIIQNYLKSNNIDSYIISDYENNNSLVSKIVGKMMLTRKLFLVIEKEKAYIICHFIDEKVLKSHDVHKFISLYVYHTWKEMLSLTKKLFTYSSTICDYCENGLLMKVANMDYGTLKYILDLGINVSSSQDLLQQILSTYDDESFSLQLKACELLMKIKDEAFAFIKNSFLKKKKINEYMVQSFIISRFHEENLFFDEPPIVAITKNAANPHYFPIEDKCDEIKYGDLVLIDLWAKLNHPKAVYADFTWMAFLGDIVPKKYEECFEIIKKTIDIDIEFLKENIGKRKVQAFEVDNVGRNYFNLTPYKDFFPMRTGHNIDTSISSHGKGANIDDYETHDTREIINNTSFSLEPGIYTDSFGLRSETNVAIRDNKVIVLGPRQEKIIPLLKEN